VLTDRHTHKPYCSLDLRALCKGTNENRWMTQLLRWTSLLTFFVYWEGSGEMVWTGGKPSYNKYSICLPSPCSLSVESNSSTPLLFPSPHSTELFPSFQHRQMISWRISARGAPSVCQAHRILFPTTHHWHKSFLLRAHVYVTRYDAYNQLDYKWSEFLTQDKMEGSSIHLLPIEAIVQSIHRSVVHWSQFFKPFLSSS
jgi:hypothetical protein